MRNRIIVRPGSTGLPLWGDTGVAGRVYPIIRDKVCAVDESDGALVYEGRDLSFDDAMEMGVRELDVEFISVPEMGDDIYIPGDGTVKGGLTKIVRVYLDVTQLPPINLVSVSADPGRSYKWESYLAPIQRELQDLFGDFRAELVTQQDTSWMSLTDLD